jgi:hypothetical protein
MKFIVRKIVKLNILNVFFQIQRWDDRNIIPFLRSKKAESRLGASLGGVLMQGEALLQGGTQGSERVFAEQSRACSWKVRSISLKCVRSVFYILDYSYISYSLL